MIYTFDEPLSIEQIDAVLEFLQVLKDEGFKPVKEVVCKPGMFGYEVWNPVL